MKNLLLVVVATLFTTVSFAQIGIKGGANLSKLNGESGGINIDSDSKVGFHFGVFTELELTEGLFLRPELLYVNKGGKFELDFSGQKIETTNTRNYIEVPIYLGYRIDLSSVNIVLNAGPYISYGISGKDKTDDDEIDIEFGSGEEEVKPLDIGLSMGAGVEFTDQLGLFLSFDPGLANLSNVDEAESRNSNIKLSVHFRL